MVARINFSSSLLNTLNYNENKLKENKAELIHAVNYGKATERLGFSDKIKRIQKQTALNDKCKKNIAHISLNFDASEKLDKETLRAIAESYMKQIGFGEQPFLVYQHFDAGHPHIHIVSTIIKNNGDRIKTHNIGRFISEKARKEIEQTFQLIPAESHKQTEAFQLKPVNAVKVQYGRSETKRAITNVLDAVLTTYKYTSLAELNAILKQYNVLADRGSEDSRTYKNKGLVYRVLDEKGNKVGVPIKASDFYSKPGLKFLEERFQQNESLRQPHKQRVKNAIDLAFAKRPVQSMDELIKVLQKEKIQLVLRQNDKGIIYGLTYIDHDKKCVFNGSDLGKQYSANAIQQRLGKQPLKQKEEPQEKQDPQQIKIPHQKQQEKNTEQKPIPFPVAYDVEKIKPAPAIDFGDGKNMLQELIQSEYSNDAIPYELKKQKRKRKRKRLNIK